MNLRHWWYPGMKDGLLSRRWAQPLVFALPRLSEAELQSSLRYKVQSLLPSQDHSLLTRLFHHKGNQYGLVIVDRLPNPRPEPKGLVVGVPLTIPPHWPAECTLAVDTPEGWELHNFQNHLLFKSYPPVAPDSAMVLQIIGQHSEKPVFGSDPTRPDSQNLPSWCLPAPAWNKSLSWGIPWSLPRPQRWHYVVGGVLAIVGLAGWLLSVSAVIAQKQERNRQWENWISTAQLLIGPSTSTEVRELREPDTRDEPMVELLVALGQVWATGVEIQRIEIAQRKVSLTARASSALSAASQLTRSALTTSFRVVQIRPVKGGEEFDVEGGLTQ